MTAVDPKRVQVGQHVKWTLEQIERTNPGRVRLDWLRFTVPLDAVVKAEPALVDVTVLDTLDQAGRDLVRRANSTDVEVYTTSHAVANAGARQIVELLGCLEVGQSLRGMDFYSARTELLFAGECVGHVLAGGKSANQAGTVHFNLWGAALLVIPVDRLAAVKAFIEQSAGRITRADLSLVNLGNVTALLFNWLAVLERQRSASPGFSSERAKKGCLSCRPFLARFRDGSWLCTCLDARARHGVTASGTQKGRRHVHLGRPNFWRQTEASA